MATLGGMVGNNSAGMRSLVYGTTADQVVGLRCVLAGGETVELRPLPRAEAERRARGEDAEARLLRCALELGEAHADEIRRRYPKIVRRVSGYGLDALVDPDILDLTRLVCGSEGTLAVVTRVDLRLHPLPAQRRVATLEFASLTAAAAATPPLLDTGPSYVELLDRVALERARANPAYRDATAFVSGDPAAVLLVEYSGEADAVGARMDALAEVGRAVGAERSAELPARDVARTVALRKAILPLLLGTTEAQKPVAFVEDAAVPPERLEEFVARFAALRRGRAHVGLLLRPRLGGLPARAPGAEHQGPGRRRPDAPHRRARGRPRGRVRRVALGRARRRPVALGVPRADVRARAGRGLRHAQAGLGPRRPAQPGRHRRAAPAWTSTCASAPGYRPGAPPTALDFSAPGRRSTAAVELCNGAGAVPQDGTGGTMCPSYMATARRARHHPRPRQRPALGHGRHAAARRR